MLGITLNGVMRNLKLMHQSRKDEEGNGPQQKTVKIGKGKRIAGVDVQSGDQNDKGVVTEY